MVVLIDHEYMKINKSKKMMTQMHKILITQIKLYRKKQLKNGLKQG